MSFIFISLFCSQSVFFCYLDAFLTQINLGTFQLNNSYYYVDLHIRNGKVAAAFRCGLYWGRKHHSTSKKRGDQDVLLILNMSFESQMINEKST